MKSSNLNIIQQLKLQPKQGMANPIGDFLSAQAAAATQLNSETEKYIAGIGALRQTIKELTDAYQDIGKDTRYLSEENKDLAKNFGLTIGEAVRLNAALQQNAKNFGVGAESLKKYATSLKGLIGQFAMQADLIESAYGKSLFQANEILQENLQLTGEQANKFTMFAALQGKTATEALVQQKSIADAIDEATGTEGNFRDILIDIAGLSEDVQLQYSKIPGDLALATAKARALGFSMSDLHKTGKQLLNIESSIGDELEYQLLSGRRLVGDKQASADLQGKSLTNAYREAVFQRKATKQADTLLTILQQEGDTLENNMFAREQMSKLLGMDEAALSRALGKKKILEKIGGEGLFNLSGQELFDAAKNLGASAEDLEQLKQDEDVRSIDQKMLANSDKMLAVLQAGLFGTIDRAEQLVTDQQAEIKKVMDKQLQQAESIGASAGAATQRTVGEAYVDRRDLTTLKNTGPALAAALASTDIETVNLYPAEVVSNGGAPLADGGIIPPGYPNDTYPAMLTSGETVIPAGESSTAGIAAFAAAIVAAINRQTDALTSNSGINAPYWS